MIYLSSSIYHYISIYISSIISIYHIYHLSLYQLHLHHIFGWLSRSSMLQQYHVHRIHLVYMSGQSSVQCSAVQSCVEYSVFSGCLDRLQPDCGHTTARSARPAGLQSDCSQTTTCTAPHYLCCRQRR